MIDSNIQQTTYFIVSRRVFDSSKALWTSSAVVASVFNICKRNEQLNEITVKTINIHEERTKTAITTSIGDLSVPVSS